MSKIWLDILRESPGPDRIGVKLEKKREQRQKQATRSWKSMLANECVGLRVSGKEGEYL